MNFNSTIALITGANKENGIGRALANALLEKGCQKIYVTARDVTSFNDIEASSAGRVKPIQLDITDHKAVALLAESCSDCNLLINNAGIAGGGSLLQPKSVFGARSDMEVNYFGTLAMCRAFSPILIKNGGGGIVNICSVAGLVGIPVIASYAASKAALHSLTQSIRGELAKKGTLVVGVYPGPIDTEMGKGLNTDLVAPSGVATKVLDAIVHRQESVFPDPVAQRIQRGLRQDAQAIEKEFAIEFGGIRLA